MDSMHADILAIDDDEETIEGLLSEFDLLGYSCDIARTLLEAKEKLRSGRYKLLLVDLRMKTDPEGTIKDQGGLDLIRKLRKGKFGSANQSAIYVFVSAQRFALERFESKIDQDELSIIRTGRIAEFSKGDSLAPLVRKISTALREMAPA
jgi:CheY-like chemotaxis protein